MPSGEPISSLPAQLEEQRRRWWVYQLSDLWHICCEALLRYTLDILDEYPSGAPLGALVSECVARVKQELPVTGMTWSDFRSAHSVSINGWGSGASEDSEFSIQHQLIRAGNANAVMTPSLALEALKLMSALATKERESRELVFECLCGRGGAGARSILTESVFLDGLDGESFASALSRILSERIIHRHLGVALAKLRHQRDYTFLIESDEGRVRLRHKAGPVVTEPRLDTTLRFLTDLRLITADGLSDRGRALVS